MRTARSTSQRGTMRAALAHIVADRRTYHSALRKGAYTTFQIPKADGTKRTIHAPNETLKAAHREALQCLEAQGIITLSDADHGFAKQRGIHTMLRTLQPAQRTIQADLEKAFHQVTEADILAWAKGNGADATTARWLAKGLTQPVQGMQGRRLVMGSPLAPAILLVLTRKLREKTAELARVFQGKCTWYADNVVLTVPARHAGRARRALARLIAGQRWTVKAEPNEDQRVLGWNWHGVNGIPGKRQTGPTGQYGWRLARWQRRRAKARISRYKKAAEAAEYTGNTHRAEITKARASALAQYVAGPARTRGVAPTYAHS